MHAMTLPDEAWWARHGDPAALAAQLRASRADTLASFARFEQALPGLRVPQRSELNLPLWELGHIGWFQGWWTTRFPAWAQGHRADPGVARGPALRADADALYNSSAVPHAARWALPLPDATTTRAELAQQLEATLALLAGVAQADDDTLYAFRLALLHEDMHHEAALYMAHGLDMALDDARWQPRPLPAPPAALRIAGGEVALGREAGAPGFAFDNECGHERVVVADFEIDAQALRWDEFLPFLDHGHAHRAHWSDAGWHWRQQQGPARRAQLLRLARPGFAACWLSAHEAAAWCHWAGRRLPTEAEWVQAQRSASAAFRWGDVWEWTASAFAPFAGFEPHPYRDYSAPWFDGRPVLKGASFLTQPRLAHPDYRNYFPAARCDLPAGLRSVATGGR
jgi:formylglycine-generating enzyme required for sulfatase activity